VFRTEQAVIADAEPFARALAERNAPPAPTGRAQWIGRLHGLYAELATWSPAPAEDGVNYGEVIMALQRQAGPDMIMTMDGGNFSSWAHRHFNFQPSHKLVAAIAGAMGLGVPAAVAAALRHPDRPVVALVGDGGFLMTGNELATAVRHDAKVRLFVSNNGSFGTIRLHQERRYRGRTMATDLNNPDFAALARAFGATGLTIDREADVDAVVAEALAADGPVVVDVRSSLEHIIAWTTLSKVRAG
jgi:acetolactate synthase-1/2/3 large subunit